MSKELPYFKFYPGEWMTGDITLCSMESQGLFANIISYYWKKECSMSLANAKQRFSKYEASLNELLNQKIIKADSNGNIIIKFLDDQMNEFINVSEKRALAGKKGGEAKAKHLPKFAKAKASNKEGDKEGNKDKNIYRCFKHLKITVEENNKLLDIGYGQSQLDAVYDDIENYKKNTNYTSLYLTATKWLKKSIPNHEVKQMDSQVKEIILYLPGNGTQLKWPENDIENGKIEFSKKYGGFDPQLVQVR